MIDYNATLSQLVHDYVINGIFLFRKNLSSSTAARNIKIVARIAVNSINCHLLLPSLDIGNTELSLNESLQLSTDQASITPSIENFY